MSSAVSDIQEILSVFKEFVIFYPKENITFIFKNETIEQDLL